MPFILIPIDSQYPPTWESVSSGVPVADYDVTDADSVLRPTEGQDRTNYFTQQRWQGDLFKRDILLAKQVKQLLDFLSSRSGVCFNTPDVAIQPLTWVTIGRMRLDATQHPAGGWLVGAMVRYLGTSFPLVGSPGAGNCRLDVVATDNTVAATAAASASADVNIFLASAITDRGTEIAASEAAEEYELRVYNTHATGAIVASAAVILQPREQAP